MNQSQPQTDKLAILYWMILGFMFAMGRSGTFYPFISVLGMYLLLTCVRPGARFELVLVASVCGGEAIVQGLQILILHPNLYNLDSILEPVIAAVVAIALLVSQKRMLAWCLVIYFVFMGVLLLWAALLHLPKETRPQFQLVDAAVNGLMAWLLVQWLQKPKTV